jgi:HPt (histidine-containing phosphotransfer) domain-containing protein
MAEIGSAMSRGDAPTVGETAHRLRGSSSTLGAAHVAQIAAELEASARAGDLAVGGEVLVRLRSGLQDTRQALRHNRAVAAATTQAASMTQSDSDRLSKTPEKAR